GWRFRRRQQPARQRPRRAAWNALQVAGAVQHDAGHAGGHRQCVDRDHLATRGLPRGPAEPADPGERQPPAGDAGGLPGRLGRLGDIYGRVKMYNAGFAIFALGALALPFDPLTGPSGAMWLIGFRIIQAIGGAMLMANAPAILTDAFPSNQRGTAMGINQV